jgi:TRAP-type mannitol/chloroaromatic compound transport system substrate-binding protein
MRRNIALILCGLLLTVFTFSGTAFAKENRIMIKLQTAYSQALPALGECLPLFKEYVETACPDTMKVKIYEPGKLVPTFQIHEAVSSGKIDAGYLAPVYLAGKVPALELFTYIPFGCDGPAYLGWLHHGGGMELYQKSYDEAGYSIKPFPFAFLAPETGGWYKKEINSVEDLKGLKLRWPGLGGKVLQELGASISMIPGSEIFSALEKGAIEGTEFSNPAIDAMLGFHKVAKYNYFPGWHQPVTHLELVLNKDVWNKMSQRQKAVWEMACQAVTTYTLSRSTAIQGKAVKENARKQGVKNKQWPKDMLETFHKTWLEVIDEETDKHPMLKKVWNSYQDYIGDYSPWACMAYLPKPECKAPSK